VKTQEQIEKAIAEIEEILPNIVEGTLTEGLYVGQLAALQWVLKEEEGTPL